MSFDHNKNNMKICYVIQYNDITKMKFINWMNQMKDPNEWTDGMNESNENGFFVIKEFDSLLVTRSSYVNDDVIIKIIN